MSTERKMFGVKDVVYLLGLVVTLSGGYYTMDGRVSKLEESEKSLKQTVEENAKTLKIIYFGLVAKGIIDPPSN